MTEQANTRSTEPTSLEHYLVEAAEHALRTSFIGADPYWIRSCARLQVLGEKRACLGEKVTAACVAMLATMETTLAGQRIPFPA